MLYNCSPEPEECGKLLSEPADNSKTCKRLTAEYKNVSDRFVYQRDRTFQKQYAHLYAARLNAMRPKLQRAAKSRWGTLIFKLPRTNCMGDNTVNTRTTDNALPVQAVALAC